MNECFSKKTGMKIKYYDREVAKMQAKKEGLKYNTIMIHYLCDHCGAYHIGKIGNQKRILE